MPELPEQLTDFEALCAIADQTATMSEDGDGFSYENPAELDVEELADEGVDK